MPLAHPSFRGDPNPLGGWYRFEMVVSRGVRYERLMPHDVWLQVAGRRWRLYCGDSRAGEGNMRWGCHTFSLDYSERSEYNGFFCPATGLQAYGSVMARGWSFAIRWARRFPFALIPLWGASAFSRLLWLGCEAPEPLRGLKI